MDEAWARAVLQRFGQFADQFGDCFGRRVQRDAASHYLEGLLNDSTRKSMFAMHGRLSAPPSYQALQHFVTDSPWSDARVWDRLRSVVPDRAGIVALDDTGLPKQGTHSVGVQRQYCGALGKIGNCQVAVSSVLIGAAQLWPLTCELYLPRAWTDDGARRERVGIPSRIRFREKWRMGLAHLRAVRRAGFRVTAVVADADYGTNAAFRRGVEKMGLHYAVALRGDVTAWTPHATRPRTVRDLSRRCPARQWRRICWAQGTKGPLAARFVALRVRLRHARAERWLLCERSLVDDERKYYLLNLPVTAALKDLVRLARSRWPIEQQYRELKDELGFDHFEGRTYRGWTHHAVLTAMAFTFLQLERRRSRRDVQPTLPQVRGWMREIVAILYVIGNRKLLSLLVSFQRNPPLRR